MFRNSKKAQVTGTRGTVGGGDVGELMGRAEGRQDHAEPWRLHGPCL